MLVQLHTTGSNNIGIGYNAVQKNTTANNNMSELDMKLLKENTTGTRFNLLLVRSALQSIVLQPLTLLGLVTGALQAKYNWS